MANIGQLPHNDARTKMVSSMKELEELDQKLVSHALAKGQERAKARGYTGENAQDFAREFAKGFCQAVEDSASKERERVQSVLAQSMPGHEALVNELAFDGKTTGPEAAAAVLQAKKRKHFVVVSRTNELK